MLAWHQFLDHRLVMGTHCLQRTQHPPLSMRWWVHRTAKYFCQSLFPFSPLHKYNSNYQGGGEETAGFLKDEMSVSKMPAQGFAYLFSKYVYADTIYTRGNALRHSTYLSAATTVSDPAAVRFIFSPFFQKLILYFFNTKNEQFGLLPRNLNAEIEPSAYYLVVWQLNPTL